MSTPDPLLIHECDCSSGEHVQRPPRKREREGLGAVQADQQQEENKQARRRARRQQLQQAHDTLAAGAATPEQQQQALAALLGEALDE